MYYHLFTYLSNFFVILTDIYRTDKLKPQLIDFIVFSTAIVVIDYK